MTAQAEKEIHEIKLQMDSIMTFIMSHDKISNVKYCEEENITTKTLYNWFKRGCPRVDNRHVLRSKVNEWKANNSTHATANTKKA
jgi:hypothetical protein